MDEFIYVPRNGSYCIARILSSIIDADSCIPHFRVEFENGDIDVLARDEFYTYSQLANDLNEFCSRGCGNCCGNCGE